MFYSEVLSKSVGSAAAARRLLDRLAGHLEPDVLDDARLLTSELVANAVEHVREDGTLELRVDLDEHTLRVELLDPGPSFIPRPRRDGDPVDSGWGLHFIARLADRWQVDVDGRARVWFELDRRPRT
jgi:anti-sigma regulatory factor (Ser/Thr protein kinase)